jgi:colanic acid biosynthesis glycosyl transferase WcaI
MKLIIVNRYFSPDESATSQMASSLGFALADRGWEVHAIASRQLYSAADAALIRREDISGVTVHRVWTTRLGRGHLHGRAIDYLSFYVGAFWSLLRLAKPGDLLIAATDPPLLSILAWAAASITRAIRINWLHDLFPEVATALGVATPGLGHRLLGHLRDLSLRRAAMNVAIGERMAAYLRRRGTPAERLTIIHNWSDGQSIRPLARELNPLRQEWDLAGKFVVGYAGNIGRAHEFETILHAAEALRDQTDIVFLFIGAGHHRAWIAAQVQALALPNVVFKPFQPAHRLRETLTVPDLHLVSLRPKLEDFIVPSKFYGISAAGCPMVFVGDPTGEIPGLLRDADCGRAISVGDVEGLVACIRQLQQSPAQSERWRKNARDLFMRRFDRPLAIIHWCHLLDRIAAEPTEARQTAGARH